MPVIGHFFYDANEDTYTGHINTLTVVRDEVWLRPTGKFGDKAPDYRVTAETTDGKADLGAAWRRTSDSGRDYCSVVIDDPALPVPLNVGHVAASGPDRSDLRGWIGAPSCAAVSASHQQTQFC